ncbi:MAG: peptidylprolyl isomerase [Bacteroidales bacterium]|nr:peptidylprolyl isomerase [Bacteroidales bacterium]
MFKRKDILLAAFFLIILSSSCSIFNNPTKINKFVEIKTNKGDFILGLYEGTPLHRDNFLNNCHNMQYDSTLIYSAMPNGINKIGLPVDKKEDDILYDLFPDSGIPPELNTKLIHKTGAIGMYRINNDKNPKTLSDNILFYLVDGIPTNEKLLRTLEAKQNIPMVAEYIKIFLQEPGHKHFEDSLTKYKQNKDNDKYSRLYIQLTDSIKPRIKADGKNLFSLSKFQIDQYTNIGGIPIYDGQYTVFGEIVAGLNILETLANVRTGLFNKPKANIYVLSTKILTKKEYKASVKATNNK